MQFAVWTHFSFVFCFRTVATRSLRKQTSWNWRSNSWPMSLKSRQMVRAVFFLIIIRFFLLLLFLFCSTTSFLQRKLNVLFFLVPRCYSKLQRRLWSVPTAGLCAPPAHEPRPTNLRTRARLRPAVTAFEFSVLQHVQRSRIHRAIAGPTRAASEPEMDRNHPERKARARHTGETPGCATGSRSAHVETLVDAERRRTVSCHLSNNVHKQPRNVL